MAMGAADIVPGVSGGSIALIAGIYQELLDSINSFKLHNLQLLAKLEVKAFYKAVNGSFLLSLLLGIMTSIFALSSLITFLMTNHPIPLWSFFTGLILISAFLILKEIKRWHLGVVLAVLIGTAIAWWVTNLPPTTTPNAIWFTFVSGAIAICAMILPGITTIGLLYGFMLGSVNELWPWKLVTSWRTSSSGEQKPFLDENIWPGDYLAQVGQEPQILAAVLAFLFGIGLVLFIEWLAAKLINS